MTKILIEVHVKEDIKREGSIDGICAAVDEALTNMNCGGRGVGFTLQDDRITFCTFEEEGEVE